MTSEIRSPKQHDIWDWILELSTPLENQPKDDVWFEKLGLNIGKIFVDKVSNLPSHRVPKDIRQELGSQLEIQNIRKLGEFLWAIRTLDTWKRCVKMRNHIFIPPNNLNTSSESVVNKAKEFDHWLNSHANARLENLNIIAKIYHNKIKAKGVVSFKDRVLSRYSIEEIKELGEFYWALKKIKLWEKWAKNIRMTLKVPHCSSKRDVIKFAHQFDSWFLSEHKGEKICFAIFKQFKTDIEKYNPRMIPLNLRLRLGDMKTLDERARFENVYYLYKFIEALEIHERWRSQALRSEKSTDLWLEDVISSDRIIKNAKQVRAWGRQDHFMLTPIASKKSKPHQPPFVPKRKIG